MAPAGRKVGSLNWRVRRHLAKREMKKIAQICGAKHISKSKCTKHHMCGPLLEVEMSKKRHNVSVLSQFQLQPPVNYNTLHSTPLQSTTLNHIMLQLRLQVQVQLQLQLQPHYSYDTTTNTTTTTTTNATTTTTTTTLHYKALRYTKNLTLDYTPLHSTPLHYTTLQYTTLTTATATTTTMLLYTTLDYTTLPYITLHDAHYTTTNTTSTTPR